jgi:uncharacterized membrane protein YjjP (DUF1212 family)
VQTFLANSTVSAVSAGRNEPAMTLEDRAALILECTRVLFVNGQSTDLVLLAGEELGEALGISAKIAPRWGELHLQVRQGENRLICETAADPTNVAMNRVTSMMHAITNLRAGRLTPSGLKATVGTIAEKHPSPTWLFALAAGFGAAALGVIFGTQHLATLLVIFVSAAAGGILRRSLARYSPNIFLQPFCAALLAGVIGALAVRYQLSSALRLAALCPCMVLVPGPPVLNGALDLARGRIHLGAARLVFAGLVVCAISTGLLLGLAVLGVSLPVGPVGRTVTLGFDVIAAAVAVAAFAVFFSMPWRMLPCSVAVGMLAHASRWGALTVLGLSAPMGALIACLLVGLALTPVARRFQMPFAAIGFASVVSMMPGVYLFRMSSGLVQLADASQTKLDLLSATFSDGMTAVTIILAMSLGLIVPKLIIDRVADGGHLRVSGLRQD